MKFLDRLTWFVIPLFIGFAFGVIITAKYNKDEYSEIDTERVDSLIKVNDSIKIKIDKLDSIKNAKIIEVSTLDNDSTVKLFYELVKE